MPDSPDVTKLKEAAAQSAVAEIHDGMIVGLGTGSTATLALKPIAQRLKQGLRMTGVPTSEQTAAQARALGIPLSTLEQHDQIDLTIDGADEVEIGALNLIKGGGGALLREKIVASASARLLIVVDETKLVERLGARAAVPVEVVQFGWQATVRKLAALGASPALRLRPDGQAFVTDGGHYILDCAFGAIADPASLAMKLDGVAGVVEHGLFIGMTSQVFVGGREGVSRLYPRRASQ